MSAHQRLLRAMLAIAAVATVWVATAPSAQAQYSNYFYYYNPRTGREYSQGGMGRGYYSGGFSTTTPYRSYSTYYGYGGRRGNRHYWGGQFYANPRRAYGYGWRK